MEKESLAHLNKVDRGMLFMLQQSKKEDTIFSIIWCKMVTLFNKEFHLRFEFKVKPKGRFNNVSSSNINS